MDNLGLLVVTAIAVLFILPYLYMRISAIRSVGKPVPPVSVITGNNADTSQPVYLYFMSKNCSMCKSMTPYIEKLKSTHADIAIIDIAKSPQLAKDYRVYGTPTLMAVSDGAIKKVKLGKLSAKKIDLFIEHL